MTCSLVKSQASSTFIHTSCMPGGPHIIERLSSPGPCSSRFSSSSHTRPQLPFHLPCGARRASASGPGRLQSDEPGRQARQRSVVPLAPAYHCRAARTLFNDHRRTPRTSPDSHARALFARICTAWHVQVPSLAGSQQAAWLLLARAGAGRACGREQM